MEILEALAAECVLKQANSRHDAGAILADYFQQAYRLGIASAEAKHDIREDS